MVRRYWVSYMGLMGLRHAYWWNNQNWVKLTFVNLVAALSLSLEGLKSHINSANSSLCGAMQYGIKSWYNYYSDFLDAHNPSLSQHAFIKALEINPQVIFIYVYWISVHYIHSDLLMGHWPPKLRVHRVIISSYEINYDYLL